MTSMTAGDAVALMRKYCKAGPRMSALLPTKVSSHGPTASRKTTIQSPSIIAMQSVYDSIISENARRRLRSLSEIPGACIEFVASTLVVVTLKNANT